MLSIFPWSLLLPPPHLFFIAFISSLFPDPFFFISHLLAEMDIPSYACHKSVLPGGARAETGADSFLRPFVFLNRAWVFSPLLYLNSPSFPFILHPTLPPIAPDSHHLDSVVAKGMEALLVTPWVQERDAENPLWFLPSSVKSGNRHSLNSSSYFWEIV